MYGSNDTLLEMLMVVELFYHVLFYPYAILCSVHRGVEIKNKMLLVVTLLPGKVQCRTAEGN